VAVVLLGGAAYYCSLYPKPKLDYNEVHPYIFQLPMLAYIFIRNITPSLRSSHLHLLAEMGKTTLETYLMQHHIWLTSNAKTLLILVPGYPLINMFATTMIYVLVARTLYRLTLNLRALLIPNDTKESFRFIGIMSTAILSSFMLAIIVSSIEVSPVLVLTVCAIATAGVCGIVKLFETHAKLAYVVLGLVLFMSIAVCSFHYSRSSSLPSPSPAPAPRTPSPQGSNKTGVASDVGLGLVMIAAASLMLGLFDNFCGLLPLALKTFGRGVVLTFEEAYEKLNAGILRSRP